MTKNQTKITWQKLKITRDAGANVKLLKKLENEGYIEIYDVMLEGGRENKKVKNKILPIAVWGHSRWDEAVWADANNPYDDLRQILGKKNIKDTMQLETHIRNKQDYFVTEDTDFLSKRKVLREKYGVAIVTPNELEKLCRKTVTRETTWRTVRLGDVASKITKGTTPTTLGRRFVSFGINFIKAESITDDSKFIPSKFEHIDAETNTALKRSIIQENDILYSIAGVIGRPALVRSEILPANTNQALAIIRPDLEKIEPRYLFYFLSTKAQKKFANNLVAQSAQPNINLEQVSNLEFQAPALKEQKHITEVLSAFDDKIENNSRIIKTLEEMAQVIFKEWFVMPSEASAKRGELLTGWKAGKIKDSIDIISGFPFPSKLFSLPTDALGVVTIKNVQDGNFVRDFNSFIKKGDLPVNFNPDCYLRDGDILLSLTGNVGRACFVYGGEFLLNQRVAKLRPKNRKDFAFCYFLFRQPTMQNYLINMGKGSAQSNLSPVETGKIDLAIPPRGKLDKFSELASPIYELLIKKSVENQKLAAMRDLLLPRLMSGKLLINK